MSTADTIYTLVRTLSDEQANTVLAFAEFIQKRTDDVDRSLGKETLSHFLGVLKDSPNFNEDPVEIQRAMRSEWD
jgi:Protein of unknown function (DUF2281)